MSTPEHPHHLRREIERGAGGQYVPARYAQMRCDGAMGLCLLSPERAPRIVVPPRPFALAAELKPLRVWTTLHYCRRHQGECNAPELLVAKMRRDIEAVAKAKWPHEYRPDFAAAFVEWILVTTPEYRAFLEKLEIGRTHSRQGVPVL
jgi:hypothetical protein